MKSAERDYNKPVKLLAIVIMLILLISCSISLEKQIIGEWHEIDGTEIIELFKDGSITLNSRYLRVNGIYKFAEKDKISVEFNTEGALKGPFVAQVSIIDNKLTWVMPDGKVSSYKRLE